MQLPSPILLAILGKFPNHPGVVLTSFETNVPSAQRAAPLKSPPEVSE